MYKFRPTLNQRYIKEKYIFCATVDGRGWLCRAIQELTQLQIKINFLFSEAGDKFVEMYGDVSCPVRYPGNKNWNYSHWQHWLRGKVLIIHLKNQWTSPGRGRGLFKYILLIYWGPELTHSVWVVIYNHYRFKFWPRSRSFIWANEPTR